MVLNIDGLSEKMKISDINTILSLNKPLEFDYTHYQQLLDFINKAKTNALV